MPSKTPAQHRLMELVAHSPAAAKRLGIKQSVGRDFVQADTHHPKVDHNGHRVTIKRNGPAKRDS